MKAGALSLLLQLKGAQFKQELLARTYDEPRDCTLKKKVSKFSHLVEICVLFSFSLVTLQLGQFSNSFDEITIYPYLVTSYENFEQI